MPANGEPRALFAANGNGILVDQLTDVFEANRRLIQANLVMIRESVDKVGGRDRLRHTVLPAARLDKVVEEQRDDVIRLDEGTVGVDNAEAVRVPVGRNSDGCARL